MLVTIVDCSALAWTLSLDLRTVSVVPPSRIMVSEELIMIVEHLQTSLELTLVFAHKLFAHVLLCSEVRGVARVVSSHCSGLRSVGPGEVEAASWRMVPGGRWR